MGILADTKLLERAATFQTVADFASFLSILPDPDPVLRKRGGGLALYRETLHDAHVYACIQSRKSGTRKLPWALEAAGDDARAKQVHAFTEDNLRRLDVHRINGEALDGPFWGFVPFEILWKRDGLSLLLDDVVGLPPEWFAFTPDGEFRFLTSRSPLEGEPVDERKFVLVRHDASYANPYGERLLSKCFWPAAFKKGDFKFWFIFTEKYGMPWAIGKHPRGASDEDITALLNSLVRFVQDAVGAIPNDTDVELKDAASRASSAQIYNLLKQACDAEISKAILSQTLTTEIGDVGSKAAVMGHLEVRQDVLDGDRVLLEAFWQEIVGRLVELNFGPDMPAPRFRLVVKEQISVSLEMAQRDKVALESGVPLSVEDYRRRHNLPAPKDAGDTIAPIAATGPGGVSFAEAAPGGDPGSWPLARTEAKNQGAAAEAFGPLVAAYQKELAACKSYDDVLALRDAFAADPGAVAALTDFLHRTLVTGYLYGRAAGVGDQNRALKRVHFAEEAPAALYTPEAAITYFRNKVALSPEAFADLDGAARAKAFTMAGVENDRLLGAIRAEVERAVAEGRPYGDFRATVNALFDKAGVSRAANYRIAQVYGDSLASAYGAGLYDELNSPTAASLFPYFRYRTAGDDRVRPLHRALEGVVVARDDPWVKTHWGPWDYGCRCWMEGITAEEARGATIARGDKLPGPTPSGFTCPAQGFLSVEGVTE